MASEAFRDQICIAKCRFMTMEFRHMQLFSMETYDQAVMDFLAAMDVGRFPPK